ncbi:MAG TPA: hypothetical protein VKZ90_00315 [Aequorivita sp.]|nr:hypothetical protein [Aequorivita sp.]
MQLILNPQTSIEFGEKDCLIKLGEYELLLEYHSDAMKTDVEKLLSNEISQPPNTGDLKMVVNVLAQQNIIFKVPTFN